MPEGAEKGTGNLFKEEQSSSEDGTKGLKIQINKQVTNVVNNYYYNPDEVLIKTKASPKKKKNTLVKQNTVKWQGSREKDQISREAGDSQKDRLKFTTNIQLTQNNNNTQNEDSKQEEQGSPGTLGRTSAFDITQNLNSSLHIAR